jgi:hypothetical protein
MKSVFCPLQALNIEKSTLDVKKEVRGGKGVAQEKTYTKAENVYRLEAMMLGGRREA